MVAREHEVSRMMKQEVHGFIPLPEKFRFKRDQRIIVSRGPYLQFMGRYKRARGVIDVVEIDIFGALREIQLPMGSLQAA
jgi:transcription antitermination factor NusG